MQVVNQLGSRIAKPMTVVGRIWASLALLLFLGMGLVLSTVVWRSATQTRFWKATDCVIVESRVVEDGSRDAPYRFRVRYAYQWQDQTFTGDRWSSQESSFSDYGEAQRLVGRYAPDRKLICYVDPNNPATAVLERSHLGKL